MVLATCHGFDLSSRPCHLYRKQFNAATEISVVGWGDRTCAGGVGRGRQPLTVNSFNLWGRGEARNKADHWTLNPTLAAMNRKECSGKPTDVVKQVCQGRGTSLPK